MRYITTPWFTDGKQGRYADLGLQAKWATPCVHALVYTGRQTGLRMPWFTQEGRLVYTCPGLHRKTNWFTHALVYTGRQTTLHMPWFIQEGKPLYTCLGLYRKANWFTQEGKLVYTCIGLHRKANWFTLAMVYTGRQTGLCMPWFTQEGKLVYVHVVHRSANWVTQKTCITDTHALAELSVSCHMAWEEDCAALFLKQAFLWQCPPSFR